MDHGFKEDEYEMVKKETVKTKAQRRKRRRRGINDL
jgi:hypothetical protein